ncbi:hypothetical protein SAFG77S_04887 [Streptomyces afghaniensis]
MARLRLALLQRTPEYVFRGAFGMAAASQPHRGRSQGRAVGEVGMGPTVNGGRCACQYRPPQADGHNPGSHTGQRPAAPGSARGSAGCAEARGAHGVCARAGAHRRITLVAPPASGPDNGPHQQGPPTIRIGAGPARPHDLADVVVALDGDVLDAGRMPIDDQRWAVSLS